MRMLFGQGLGMDERFGVWKKWGQASRRLGARPISSARCSSHLEDSGVRPHFFHTLFVFGPDGWLLTERQGRRPGQEGSGRLCVL